MRISARSEYAILALMELARDKDRRPKHSQEIARKTGIRKPFLDQLLFELKRNGLVRSVRGPKGGYSLAVAPKEITLKKVLEAIEGTVLSVLCPLKSADGAMCEKDGTCALQETWENFAAEVDRFLEGITIQHLMERQAVLDAIPSYEI